MTDEDYYRLHDPRQRVKVHIFPTNKTYAGTRFVCLLLAALVIQGCNQSDVSANAPVGKKGKGRGGDGGPVPVVVAKVVQKSVPIEIGSVGNDSNLGTAFFFRFGGLYGVLSGLTHTERHGHIFLWELAASHTLIVPARSDSRSRRLRSKEMQISQFIAAHPARLATGALTKFPPN